jgi:hypothetical protein
MAAPLRQVTLQDLTPHEMGADQLVGQTKMLGSHVTVPWQAASAACPNSERASGSTAGSALESADSSIDVSSPELRSSGLETLHAATTANTHNQLRENFISDSFLMKGTSLYQQAQRQTEVGETRLLAPAAPSVRRSI